MGRTVGRRGVKVRQEILRGRTPWLETPGGTSGPPFYPRTSHGICLPRALTSSSGSKSSSSPNIETASCKRIIRDGLVPGDGTCRRVRCSVSWPNVGQRTYGTIIQLRSISTSLPQKHTGARAHTHAHTHTQAHTHAHARTHTHTRVMSPNQALMLHYQVHVQPRVHGFTFPTKQRGHVDCSIALYPTIHS